MLKLALVVSLLAGCVTSTLPNNGYGYRYVPRHHVVYVDGVSYVDRGVISGPAPADTIIPTDDPEVGQLTPPSP